MAPGKLIQRDRGCKRAFAWDSCKRRSSELYDVRVGWIPWGWNQRNESLKKIHRHLQGALLLSSRNISRLRQSLLALILPKNAPVFWDLFLEHTSVFFYLCKNAQLWRFAIRQFFKFSKRQIWEFSRVNSFPLDKNAACGKIAKTGQFRQGKMGGLKVPGHWPNRGVVILFQQAKHLPIHCLQVLQCSVHRRSCPNSVLKIKIWGLRESNKTEMCVNMCHTKGTIQHGRHFWGSIVFACCPEFWIHRKLFCSFFFQSLAKHRGSFWPRPIYIVIIKDSSTRQQRYSVPAHSVVNLRTKWPK